MVDPAVPALLVVCGTMRGTIEPEYERRARPIVNEAGLKVAAEGTVAEQVTSSRAPFRLTPRF